MATEILPLPPGDSSSQRRVESILIGAVGAQLGVVLQPRVFKLASGNRITVDGMSEAPPVLVEAWAHIGQPKPAQKAKVMTDALKLNWIRSTLVPNARCVLALADDAAASHFISTTTWMGDCLRQLAIDVVVAAIEPQTREELLEAQRRQYR